MNILFHDFGSYTYSDISEAFIKAGHCVKLFYYHVVNKYEDVFLSERLSLELSEGKYDFVFGVNFFPVVAKTCHDFGVPYVSWSYDSPLEEKLSESFAFDTNYIFLFDRDEVERYRSLGHGNVYHLPLAVNAGRLSKMSISKTEASSFSSDISFVGRIYDRPLDAILCFSNEYIKGYVEAIFQAQFNVYGANIVDLAVTDALLGNINDSFAKNGQSDLMLTRQGLSFAILKQITSVERELLAKGLAENCDFKLYTTDPFDTDCGVTVRRPVKYYSEMPMVFRCSKLNLAPTLRSISSGIPLRDLDILGAGGCLFSNFQRELAEYFQDGSDVIMYGSFEEAFDKARYYLKNDELRKKIARNGHEKVKRAFSYTDRIGIIMKVVNS